MGGAKISTMVRKRRDLQMRSQLEGAHIIQLLRESSMTVGLIDLW